MHRPPLASDIIDKKGGEIRHGKIYKKGEKWPGLSVVKSFGDKLA